VVVDGWPATAEVEQTARELMALIPVECIRALKGMPDARSEVNASETPAAPAGAGRNAIDPSRHVKLHGVSAAERMDGRTGEEQ